MKLFAKKTAPKKTAFTAINESTLKQVKGGKVNERRTSSTEID